MLPVLILFCLFLSLLPLPRSPQPPTMSSLCGQGVSSVFVPPILVKSRRVIGGPGSACDLNEWANKIMYLKSLLTVFRVITMKSSFHKYSLIT